MFSCQNKTTQGIYHTKKVTTTISMDKQTPSRALVSTSPLKLPIVSRTIDLKDSRTISSCSPCILSLPPTKVTTPTQHPEGYCSMLNPTPSNAMSTQTSVNHGSAPQLHVFPVGSFRTLDPNNEREPKHSPPNNPTRSGQLGNISTNICNDSKLEDAYSSLRNLTFNGVTCSKETDIELVSRTVSQRANRYYTKRPNLITPINSCGQIPPHLSETQAAFFSPDVSTTIRPGSKATSHPSRCRPIRPGRKNFKENMISLRCNTDLMKPQSHHLSASEAAQILVNFADRKTMNDSDTSAVKSKEKNNTICLNPRTEGESPDLALSSTLHQNMFHESRIESFRTPLQVRQNTHNLASFPISSILDPVCTKPMNTCTKISSYKKSSYGSEKQPNDSILGNSKPPTIDQPRTRRKRVDWTMDENAVFASIVFNWEISRGPEQDLWDAFLSQFGNTRSLEQCKAHLRYLLSTRNLYKIKL